MCYNEGRGKTMKVKTFKQPVMTEEQERWLNHEQHVFAYSGCYECRFVYNLKDHTIYDAIMNDSFRMNSHSLVFSVHDNLEKMEKDCARLSFCTECYARGDLMWNDLGIEGLRISELYGVQYGLDEEILSRLTKQDLDNIDKYCQELKKEWESLRNEHE